MIYNKENSFENQREEKEDSFLGVFDKKSKTWILRGGRVPSLFYLLFITSLRDDERVRKTQTHTHTHTHTHNKEAQGK